MFEVSVEQTFAAGHALRNYKGKCENVHGHNFKVQVVIEGETPGRDRPAGGFHRSEERDARGDRSPGSHFSERRRAVRCEESVGGKHRGVFSRRADAQGWRQAVPIRIREVKVWETDIQSATYRV